MEFVINSETENVCVNESEEFVKDITRRKLFHTLEFFLA